jgi:hypothetical protein
MIVDSVVLNGNAKCGLEIIVTGRSSLMLPGIFLKR